MQQHINRLHGGQHNLVAEKHIRLQQASTMTWPEYLKHLNSKDLQQFLNELVKNRKHIVLINNEQETKVEYYFKGRPLERFHFSITMCEHLRAWRISETHYRAIFR